MALEKAKRRFAESLYRDCMILSGHASFLYYLRIENSIEAISSGFKGSVSWPE